MGLTPSRAFASFPRSRSFSSAWQRSAFLERHHLRRIVSASGNAISMLSGEKYARVVLS